MFLPALCPMLAGSNMVRMHVYIMDFNPLHQRCLRTSRKPQTDNKLCVLLVLQRSHSPRVVSANPPLYDSIPPVLVSYSPVSSAFCKKKEIWKVTGDEDSAFKGLGRGKIKLVWALGSNLNVYCHIVCTTHSCYLCLCISRPWCRKISLLLQACEWEVVLDLESSSVRIPSVSSPLTHLFPNAPSQMEKMDRRFSRAVWKRVLHMEKHVMEEVNSPMPQSSGDFMAQKIAIIL